VMKKPYLHMYEKLSYVEFYGRTSDPSQLHLREKRTQMR